MKRPLFVGVPTFPRPLAWGIPILILLMALWASLSTVVHWVTESWWFAAVGYGEVFWQRWRWQMGTWLVTLGLGVMMLLGNYWLALGLCPDSPWRIGTRSPWPTARIGRLIHGGAIALSGLMAFNLSLRSAGAWDQVLRFLHSTPFGQTDPLFQRDIAFYVFRLPVYEGVLTGVGELLLWSLVLAIALYALKGEIRPQRGWKYFLTGAPKAHICCLLALLAVVVAVRFLLQRYELLFSPAGVVFGAGFADIHARLPAYTTMAFVTLAVAVLFLLALSRGGFWLPLAGIGIYIGMLLLVVGLYPWLQQQVIVGPNELDKELPYLERSLTFTRAAYQLDQVDRQEFPAETSLTAADLDANQATIDNIRLWDYRPALSTYRQLQEIRLYYRFQDVDVDRYVLNGDYRQVMLAPREMDYTQAPVEAQNWVNQRLKFTHGYGLVMSPVNQATSEGLPELLIRDVPLVSDVDLPIEEPRIYYGEATRSYMFTGTTTDEFDYPSGDDNVVNRYTGLGGVPMGSLGRRLVYAYELGDLRTLISNYLAEDTRIHYHRAIVQRARQVAPFLTYDGDPYLTVVEGRLKWILDAYTTSDRYPYAQPLIRSGDVGPLLSRPGIAAIARQGTNYIRDAAKVVVDAYDGSLTFYAVDDQEPILSTYGGIFPTLFQPAAAMPSELREHLRYPEDLFTIQSQIYRAYHMVNGEVFYNREDVWRFPQQLYEGETVTMEPYHLIMQLPEAAEPEFIQILPFTPINRDNMVAWLAGRSDGDHYGDLVLYQFPKQQLVYGPSQIEARVNQTPEISEQLTLWGQQGSRVIRGDLLVIPIQRSLLYVEPVYLRAEQGALPELRRVILAYGDQVVMAATLEAGLEEIFGDRSAVAPAAPEVITGDIPAPAGVPLSPAMADQIAAALAAYEAGQAALRAGDWPAYGAAQAELEQILTELSQDPAATP